MPDLEKRNIQADEMMLLDDEDEDTQADKYMTFRTGKESYGISIRNVIEIIELQKISEVPDMPEYVKGVINLRGKVIPVVDLRLRFKLESREYDDRTCIIVADVEKILIGFIVDSVEEVLEIPEKQIEPPPQFKTASGRDRYISGIGKVGDTVKILLDIRKLVIDEDLKAMSDNSAA